jgi:HSP20 family molecular chaperone IbpA
MSNQLKQQTPARNGLERQPAESTRGERVFAPGIDIYETESELLLYADLPGADPAGIDLRYEQGELTLRARVAPREHKGRLLLGEYADGDFFRSFRVHESINAAKIEAEYRHGVLIVHLPKQEQAKPRQVTVRVQ